MNQNAQPLVDTDTQFHELSIPQLSIQRKCLERIEKQIGIRKWSRAE